MRIFRPTAALFVLATLLSVTASLPVLAQSGEATSITHRQSVRTEMSPSGEVEASRIFTQLTVQGEGDVEVVLPAQATRGLRNLDGFGRPTIDRDQVTFNVSATPDGTNERTVATHRDPLPIELDVSYRLDGSPVEPQDLVGRSGELEVSFTVRNTTAEPTEITYQDGVGATYTEMIDVAVPFVGSVSMELDNRFVGIDAPGASVAGNGRGDTVVSWSLVLFEPVGSEEQTVTYTAQVSDAIVPGVVAQFLPVDSNSFGSLASVQDTFGDVADGLREIAGGGLQIDANLQALAIGAGQLFQGVGRLASGSDQLAAGLNDTAVPGSRQLADGTGAASDGGRQLAVGAGTAQEGSRELAAGMGTARAGGQELASGLGQLSSGAGELSAGLGQASSGGSELATGLGQLEAGAGDVNTGIAGVRAGVGNSTDTASDGTVIGGVNSLRAGIAGVPDSVEDALEVNLGQALNGIVLPQLQTNLAAGLEQNMKGALQTQVKGPLVEQLSGNLESGLTAALSANLERELAQNLAGALQAPPPNGPGLEAAMATAFADGFASQFAPAFAAGFSPQFADGFAGQVDPQLTAAFDQFAAAFAPQFAAGFAAQVEPSFSDFSEQFAAQFAAGLDDTLNAEALPGFDQLLGGLDNPNCNTNDPTNPSNPCGIAQVLGLLDAGSSDLAAGASAASAGASDLSSGLGQLDAGGQQLAGGASAAAVGSRDLTSGLGQLDDGANQLAGGLGQLGDGARDLADGLGQLDDGANQLADGLGDAGDGAQVVADGLVTVEDGMGGVAEGSRRLTDEGTSPLVAGASEATITPAVAVEHAKAADARGQAGEGLPYGTVDDAEASAVYQFELAAMGSPDGGPSTPMRIIATVLAMAGAGGLALALRRRLA
ncbi:MAG: hypothetical protein EA340_07810 [Nitriliruptor sp.]|nr:MAG: hypothetical protein EA340_07810 [Nitriliruptor sp.]